jgi:hypothetical protein
MGRVSYAVQYTRRRVLALSAGTIASGTAAGLTLTGNAQGTQAEVSMGSLTIPNKEAFTEGKPVRKVVLSVNANYEYSGNRTPDTLELLLKAGSSQSDLYTIAQERYTDDLSESGSGSVELSGGLMGTPAFGVTSFSVPDEGDEKTNSLYAELVFDVYAGMEKVASASVSESAVITVANEEVSVDAQLGGEGEVRVVTG